MMQMQNYQAKKKLWLWGPKLMRLISAAAGYSGTGTCWHGIVYWP
jgi:hypothetical protein